MAAYLLADIEIIDPAGYEAYRQGVPATIAAYGGRYCVRGGATAILEGASTPHRVVLLEFPDMARLRAWYDSPEYRPLRALRERCARSALMAMEGV